MKLSSKAILARVGAGESIATICAAAGLSRKQFDDWWQAELTARVPSTEGQARHAVRKAVDIGRDAWGIPHIHADNDQDLFFGFGYAMAQDRLWQLDYLRRKGAGRLAEILGPDALEYDLLVRTIGLRHLAENEWRQLPQETRTLLTSFSSGINAHIEDSRQHPPIEFDLLDYRPEPWTPLDSLVIERELQWYLTGRFPVIVMPELAKRALGDGPLFRAFLERESDKESIVHPGTYPTTRGGSRPVGTAAGDPDGATGSNNWVVDGRRTTTGKPMVASDPHIAFEAVSCWYEAHLCGGSFNVAGMAYVGMPAILFGRNEHVAWGCTNNICSQRDLYQEQTSPEHPGCFLYDGQWLPSRQREEVVAVRGASPVRKTVVISHNGPIVDEVLPPAARGTGPVSIRWLGTERGGWLTSQLQMDRARTADDFRQALRPWYVPTFCMVFADVKGHIGYHASGGIPIRNIWERGYRPGWDPAHQWDGLIPFEGMPQMADPPQGFAVTANHRPAPDDFAYPLSGTWGDDHRAVRIRERIEAVPRLSAEQFGNIHQETLSPRARNLVPKLLDILKADNDVRVQQAVKILSAWDYHETAEAIGPTLFDVFFSTWSQTVAAARFEGETGALLSGGVAGLSARLLGDEAEGWFPLGQRKPAILAAFRATLDFLSNRLGPDINTWTWGSLHRIPLRHVLTARGELSSLLDHGGQPCQGGLTTICNVSPGPDWNAKIGAGYRLVADLSTSPAELSAIDCQSQSGHPGSPHYADQLPEWLAGRYHRIPLDQQSAREEAVATFTLQP
ncbi:MAG: penicillin acylase family protein [Pirellulales bacterium]